MESMKNFLAIMILILIGLVILGISIAIGTAPLFLAFVMARLLG